MTRRELTDEQIEARMPKKAGRPAMPAAQAVAVVLNGGETAQEVAAVDGLAQLQASYGQGRDLVNQLLGQAQAFQAAGNLLRTFGVSKLALVKENKLYQQLSGMKAPNGSELKGTWVEFCGLLGISDDKANEDINNLNAFGEDALEQMQRIGIGYRELRQYRKLPEDQKQALIEVAKAGDKEGFVELAEEIIAKHAKEKEALTAQVQEAQATLEAKDRVLQTRAELIGKLEEQTARKFKPLPGSEARTAQEQALLKELDEATSSAFLSMHRTFKAADAALSDSGARDAIQSRARQAVEFMAQQLADMAEEFGIEVDLDERITPAWLNEDAIAALQARNAANPHTNPRAQ
jgi:flagellar biosynthesis chaperone FliJ